MKFVCIGATSAIAQETINKLIAEHINDISIVFVGRNKNRLNSLAKDAKIRGATETYVQSISTFDPSEMEQLVKSCWDDLDGIDCILIAHGTLPEQKKIQNDWQAIDQALQVNALSYMAIMSAVATQMEQKGSGIIAVISSVAGDRGRKSNYVYGMAKGSVSLFAQGLRNRLADRGVHVLTIKPGFVDTPMTASFDKGGPLWAKPEKVASDIANAIKKKRNIIYTPGFWFIIMTVIKNIPEFIFKKLSL